MSKELYIIKFTSNEDYEQHKEYLTELGEYYSIAMKNTIWIFHRLSVEDSQKVKELGINISYDGDVVETF